LDFSGKQLAAGTVAAQFEGTLNVPGSVYRSKQAVAGVNLDEEMTNMVRFQKAYEASARYFTVMDEAMDTLMRIAG